MLISVLSSIYSDRIPIFAILDRCVTIMNMQRLLGLLFSLLLCVPIYSQINTDRVLTIGRNALYFEDYVLSIQYFNQVIQAKPYLYEPYFFRGIAKVMLEDYKGAEEDCTLALERNPFVIGIYSCRGYSRQKNGNIDGAIADYQKGLELNPDDRQLRMNMGIAYAQNKKFDRAAETFSRLIAMHPSYAPAYLNRGAMFLEKGDTMAALKDIDTVLVMDKYSSRAYAMRGLIDAKRSDFEPALVNMNEAIRLDSRNTDYYINRAMVKYRLNDLRGSMKDYDSALEFEPYNLIARFNRGLLRSYVGDYNRAIEDFDYVIDQEPDNYIAIYNRALVQTEVGELKNAIRDYTTIINRYPDFLPAYYARSEAKRKGLDRKGAEDDYAMALKLEYENRNGKKEAKDENDEEEVRETSDQNIRKFNRLVVADGNAEKEKFYTNPYRGKVQNRNAEINLLPLYYFSCYKKDADLYQKVDYYTGVVSDMNKAGRFSTYLWMINTDTPLNSVQISERFASIDRYSAEIDKDSCNIYSYIGRSVDFMLIQDLNAAKEDCERVLKLDTLCIPAYINRAYLIDKLVEYAVAAQHEEVAGEMPVSLSKWGETTGASNRIGTKKPQTTETKNKIEYQMILRDYTKVLQIDPKFVAAYYNRAVIYCRMKEYQLAINDYTKAIDLEPEFAEAYFNRGLTFILQGNPEAAISDLSKAGEKGIAEAYNIIKRYSE